jgi:hypothetical protein
VETEPSGIWLDVAGALYCFGGEENGGASRLTQIPNPRDINSVSKLRTFLLPEH